MSQSLSAQVTRPHLRYLAVAASIGLQIAINRANTFFPTSSDVSQDGSGNFILSGQWPSSIEPIMLISGAAKFKIVADSTGAILELHEIAKNQDTKINGSLIDSRILAVLLGAWADEQIEKSSPGLFTKSKIFNEQKAA